MKMPSEKSKGTSNDREDPRDANPMYKRLPAEVVSRRTRVEPTPVEQFVPQTIELDQVLQKKAEGRAKWLAKALQQAAEGRLNAQSLYEVVAHTRFIEDLTDKTGKKMYRTLHANLGVFSTKQRKFLEKESSLARAYAKSAFAGNQKDDAAEGSKGEEAVPDAMEEMMARCRAFVRDKQVERGERAPGSENAEMPQPTFIGGIAGGLGFGISGHGVHAAASSRVAEVFEAAEPKIAVPPPAAPPPAGGRASRSRSKGRAEDGDATKRAKEKASKQALKAKETKTKGREKSSSASPPARSRARASPSVRRKDDRKSPEKKEKTSEKASEKAPEKAGRRRGRSRSSSDSSTRPKAKSRTKSKRKAKSSSSESSRRDRKRR